MAVDNVVADDRGAPRTTPRRLPWTTWLPAVLIALGGAIRIRQWVGGRSLWLDEAMVARNVLDLGFRGLAGELRYNQGAPAGWLWAERVAYLAFGPEERPLRLVPLVTGIAALVVLWVLARHLVGPRRAAVAVAIAALSPQLVRYSNEVKQYQTDVLAYVAIVLVAVMVAEAAPGTARWRRLVLAWAVVGAGAVWGSHPAVLMLAPAAVLVALPLLRRGDWRSLALWVSACATWSLSWAVHYQVSLRPLGENSGFRTYWQRAFPDQPLTAGSLGEWLARLAGDLVDDPLAFGPTALTLAAIALGAVRLVAARPLPGLVALAPLPVFLAVAAASRYPLYERLALALVPMAALCLAALWPSGLDLRRPGAAAAGAAAAALVAVVAVPPMWRTLPQLVTRDEFQELRAPLEALRDERRDGDLVLATVGSQHAANYYGSVLGLQTNGVFLPGEPDGPCDDLTTLANAGADRARTWLVVSHRLGMSAAQERDLIDRFGLVAGVRDRHLDENAGVWLFDPALPPAATPADFPSGPCLRIVRLR
ncbi:MAG TPA: glycosyltransferase family 39 protein [Acidimicrobiales bacterium]